MKVLQITPIWPSAITIMAKQIVRHNKDMDIRLVTFHPKRPDAREIQQIKDFWPKADLIDMQYWKSGAKIKELLPDLWPKKKKILTHYNPYNLKEDSWSDYVANIVVNNYQKTILPEAKLFPLCIDLDFFTFNRKHYTLDPVVNMTVSRIEGKKGVLEVAQACHDLQYKFILVGRVADGEYHRRVMKAGGKYIVFRNNVSDIEVKKGYYESAVHVCNSVDNFESGPLPALEAMACGVPVLSRRVGHIPDIYNGKNLHIIEGKDHEIDKLKVDLQNIMNDRRCRVNLRIEAEKSIQDRSDKTRAAQYRKLYEEIA